MQFLAPPLLAFAVTLLPTVAAAAQQPGDELDLPSGARCRVLAAGHAEGATAGPTDRVTAHVVGPGLPDPAGAGEPEPIDTRADGLPVGVHLDGLLAGARVPVGLSDALARMRPGDRWQVTLMEGAGGTEASYDVEVVAVDPGPGLPAFRKPGPGAERAESGLELELVAPGTGEPAAADEPVLVRYTVWTEDGELIESSLATGVDLLATVDRMKVPALREVAPRLAPGAVALVRAPATLGFGAEGYRGRAAGAPTVWRLELLRVLRPGPVPAFAPGDPAALQRTESGLGYEVLRAGSGLRARPGDRVLVRYAGWLPDGTLFDESYSSELPFDLPRGGAVLREGYLVPGWVEGIPLMREGGSSRFTLPPALGYGDREQGGIPAGSTLVFQVELVAVL